MRYQVLCSSLGLPTVALGLPRVSICNTPACLYLKLLKKRYSGLFSASLRYIERKSAIIEGTIKRRGGYRYSPFNVTVYEYVFVGKRRCSRAQSAPYRWFTCTSLMLRLRVMLNVPSQSSVRSYWQLVTACLLYTSPSPRD